MAEPPAFPGGLDKDPSGGRRLRVLTLVESLGLSGGGAERLAYEIAIRLDPVRFESTLCLTRHDPMLRTEAGQARLSELRRAGVEVMLLGRRTTTSLLAWHPFVSLVRRRAVDVVHAHKFGSNVWAALLARPPRVPVLIAHEHTWSFEGQPLRKLLDGYLIGRAVSAFVAVSREDARRMVEIEHVPRDKVQVVSNGIPAALPGDPACLRDKLAGGGEKLIGFVGALRHQKALHDLIEAANLLQTRHPEAHWLIVGEGSDRSRLEQMIAERNLEKRVHMLGHTDAIHDVLAGLDVAVLCSSFEGSPLAVMEYMQAVKPIVATAVGGVPDLVTDEKHGLLVPAADPPALAAAVERLLENPRLAARLAAAARERQQAEFTIDAMVERISTLYLQLHEQASA